MIPQGWQEKKLFDIADITTGKWDANHSVESGLYKFYTCASEPLYCNTYLAKFCNDMMTRAERSGQCKVIRLY